MNNQLHTVINCLNIYCFNCANKITTKIMIKSFGKCWLYTLIRIHILFEMFGQNIMMFLQDSPLLLQGMYCTVFACLQRNLPAKIIFFLRTVATKPDNKLFPFPSKYLNTKKRHIMYCVFSISKNYNKNVIKNINI